MSLPHLRVTGAPVADAAVLGTEPTRTVPPTPGLGPSPFVSATPITAPPGVTPALPSPATEGARPPIALDLEALVDKVQRKLLRRLADERERKGVLP